MNILFVTHHSEFVGGGELSQVELMQALHAEGENTILGVPSGGWSEAQVTKYGIETLYFPMPKISLWNGYVTVRAWLRIIKGIVKPDIIHANTSRSCFYAGLVGKLLGIPVIFHCRIADSDPKLDWMLAHLAHCVVANSNATAARFRRWSKLDVRTVYNGVDVQGVNSGSDERPFGAQLVLLCVARVSHWKRHDIILRAFEQLAISFEGLHLICIGASDPHETDWWDLLQLKTAKSDFSGRIHWVGMKENMAPWYRGADVLFLASEKEPFGRVIIEGMAHGLPVVAFDKGGPAEIISDGVQGILLNEQDNVADKLKILFADKGTRRNMAEAGQKRAGDFSLAQHMRQMQKIFLELVKQE